MDMRQVFEDMGRCAIPVVPVREGALPKVHERIARTRRGMDETMNAEQNWILSEIAAVRSLDDATPWKAACEEIYDRIKTHFMEENEK